ncbi:hypothetical protein TIFTF001_020617 [Ficus carica]|uniref:Uncharacterized protein n=1 Tax=Ficus carica TaxID=3494 RepID=A0AA88AE36_FICCA|nr:hypothetical protein TIFTF001_020617 [Ficus carica]
MHVDARNGSGSNTHCERVSRSLLASHSTVDHLQKGKHLGMMETPVWCLPWALRCLSQQGY